MKNNRNIIWGVILIAIGIVLGGNALGLFNISLFFDGWWTLFIIIPSLIGLFNDDDKKGNLIALAIGFLLLLACQELISFDLIWKLLLPIIIILIGLSLIFKNSSDKETNKRFSKVTKSTDNITATFSGQDVKLDNEVFKGTNINAIFGGVKLDLRKATIKDDVVINISAIFGGVDIFVPDNVIVKVKSTPIFGGVSNKKDSNHEKNAKTIFIDATCVFGGVEIK